MPQHFPLRAMGMLSHYGASFEHLLMAAGYAAALVLATPRLLETKIGARIEAAGKLAFSNYLGTTVLMTAIFNGWGLGLFDRFGPLAQVPFVLLGWALMLPLAAPTYVVAYLYTGLLDYAGPVQRTIRSLFGFATMREYWFPDIRSVEGAIAMMALTLYP